MRYPPKAEVTGSTPVGCTNTFNDLDVLLGCWNIPSNQIIEIGSHLLSLKESLRLFQLISEMGLGSSTYISIRTRLCLIWLPEQTI